MENSDRTSTRVPCGAPTSCAETVSPALDLHLDASRSGVERVLYELLAHGRRTLDHFAGSDLIGERGREQLDTTGHESFEYHDSGHSESVTAQLDRRLQVAMTRRVKKLLAPSVVH